MTPTPSHTSPHTHTLTPPQHKPQSLGENIIYPVKSVYSSNCEEPHLCMLLTTLHNTFCSLLFSADGGHHVPRMTACIILDHTSSKTWQLLHLFSTNKHNALLCWFIRSHNKRSAPILGVKGNTGISFQVFFKNITITALFRVLLLLTAIYIYFRNHLTHVCLENNVW